MRQRYEEEKNYQNNIVTTDVDNIVNKIQRSPANIKT